MYSVTPETSNACAHIHTIHFFNFIYSDCQTKMPKSANPGYGGTLNRIVILCKTRFHETIV